MKPKQEYFSSKKLILLTIAIVFFTYAGVEDGLDCDLGSLVSIPVFFGVQLIWCFLVGMKTPSLSFLQVMKKSFLYGGLLIIFWLLLSRNCLSFDPVIRVSGMIFFTGFVSLYIGKFLGQIGKKYRK